MVANTRGWLNTYEWPEVECLVSARHEGCLHPERSRRARLRFAALSLGDAWRWKWLKQA